MSLEKAGEGGEVCEHCAHGFAGRVVHEGGGGIRLDDGRGSRGDREGAGVEGGRLREHGDAVDAGEEPQRGGLEGRRVHRAGEQLQGRRVGLAQERLLRRSVGSGRVLQEARGDGGVEAETLRQAGERAAEAPLLRHLAARGDLLGRERTFRLGALGLLGELARVELVEAFPEGLEVSEDSRERVLAAADTGGAAGSLSGEVAERDCGKARRQQAARPSQEARDIGDGDALGREVGAGHRGADGGEILRLHAQCAGEHGGAVHRGDGGNGELLQVQRSGERGQTVGGQPEGGHHAGEAGGDVRVRREGSARGVAAELGIDAGEALGREEGVVERGGALCADRRDEARGDRPFQA